MSTSSSYRPPQIGASLRLAWERVTEEIWGRLAVAGYDDVRRIHRPIMRNLMIEVRPTDMAANIGLSKQAVNDILREYEAKGYITLVIDPDDRRAKRIQLTERGRSLSDAIIDMSAEIDRRFAKMVGKDNYAIFRDVLSKIADIGPTS